MPEREIVYSLKEAQVVIEMWRTHYNTIRPHRPSVIVPRSTELDHGCINRTSSFACKILALAGLRTASRL